MSLCINPQCQKAHNSDTIIFCQGCGSELLIDGRYRVARELGQGGFGTTYEVTDLQSRPWVLKVLTDNHPKYVELFQQEAQVLNLIQHPGIPRLDLDGYFTYFAEGRTEPLHCLVMDKIEGLNLAEYIKQRGHRPIKPKRALRWLAELSLILDRVHSHNFFHRDIKPANIMLRANGCLVLIDFGTAREVTDSYIQKQAVGEITGVVTQGYTPIEQMKGKAVLQSDFYALGGTMIFLLTARNPGDFYNITDDRFHWRDGVADLPPQFGDLIDRMMAFSPLKRPRDSQEIFNSIVAIDSSLKLLAEDFNAPTNSSQLTGFSATTHKAPATPVTHSPSNQTTAFNSAITPEFVERCRQELATFIGPIANIICNQKVKQNPQMSKMDLCLALVASVSEPAQAQVLQQRLMALIN